MLGQIGYFYNAIHENEKTYFILLTPFSDEDKLALAILTATNKVVLVGSGENCYLSE